MTTHEDGANNPVDDGKKDPVDSGKTEMVPRSHARKILDEKKKVEKEAAELRARLDELEANQKYLAEQKLAEEKKWQELADARAKELEKMQVEVKKREALLEASKKEKENAKKKNEFLAELGTKFKKDSYMDKFLDIDEVPEDPDERKEFVRRFKDEYSELLVPTSATPPPATPPKSNGGDVLSPRQQLEAYNRMRFSKK